MAVEGLLQFFVFPGANRLLVVGYRIGESLSRGLEFVDFAFLDDQEAGRST